MNFQKMNSRISVRGAPAAGGFCWAARPTVFRRKIGEPPILPPQTGVLPIPSPLFTAQRLQKFLKLRLLRLFAAKNHDDDA